MMCLEIRPIKHLMPGPPVGIKPPNESIRQPLFSSRGPQWRLNDISLFSRRTYTLNGHPKQLTHTTVHTLLSTSTIEHNGHAPTRIQQSTKAYIFAHNHKHALPSGHDSLEEEEKTQKDKQQQRLMWASPISNPPLPLPQISLSLTLPSPTRLFLPPALSLSL